MKQYTENIPTNDTHCLHDSGKRNRIERRTASTWQIKEDKKKTHWADAFKTLILVHRQVDRFNTRKKDGVTSEETAYYLCDLKLSAEEANKVVRDHWGIENRRHHVRDTRLNEAASRIRKNPRVFALRRSFVLNIFRFNKVGNSSLALYYNTLELDNILVYKGL